MPRTCDRIVSVQWRSFFATSSEDLCLCAQCLLLQRHVVGQSFCTTPQQQTNMKRTCRELSCTILKGFCDLKILGKKDSLKNYDNYAERTKFWQNRLRCLHDRFSMGGGLCCIGVHSVESCHKGDFTYGFHPPKNDAKLAMGNSRTANDSQILAMVRLRSCAGRWVDEVLSKRACFCHPNAFSKPLLRTPLPCLEAIARLLQKTFQGACCCSALHSFHMLNTR